DVEEPAGLQVAGDEGGPGCQVRQPAEDAIGRVDDVEAVERPQGLGQLVEIAADELRLCPRLDGQAARARDALARKVDACGDGPAAGPGEGVEAEMTLQVKK